MGLNGYFFFFSEISAQFQMCFPSSTDKPLGKKKTEPHNEDLKCAQKSASKSCFNGECSVLCKHKCPYRLCTILYAFTIGFSSVVQTGTDNIIIFVMFSVGVLQAFLFCALFFVNIHNAVF